MSTPTFVLRRLLAWLLDRHRRVLARPYTALYGTLVDATRPGRGSRRT